MKRSIHQTKLLFTGFYSFYSAALNQTTALSQFVDCEYVCTVSVISLLTSDVAYTVDYNFTCLKKLGIYMFQSDPYIRKPTV